MENMTIKQLKEIAGQKGITLSAKAKKAEIIEILNGSKKEAESKPKKVRNFSGEY